MNDDDGSSMQVQDLDMLFALLGRGTTGHGAWTVHGH